MALVFDDKAIRKLIEDEVAHIVREAAGAGASLDAQGEAKQLALRFPNTLTVAEFSDMIIRATANVPDSSVEFGRDSGSDR